MDNNDSDAASLIRVLLKRGISYSEIPNISIFQNIHIPVENRDNFTANNVQASDIQFNHGGDDN